jgi:hypothetical protein
MPGMGFMVTSRSSDYKNFSSQFTGSGTKTTSSGSEHYIIKYEWSALKASDGTSVPVRCVAEWMFLTGRDNPVVSVTFDTSSVSIGTYSGNAIAPEGDFEFSGASGSTVDGVGWGDKYKFLTTSSPVSFNSTWTYNTANTVPYVTEWNTASNSEVGLVQTQNFSKHEGGAGIFYSNWTKTSATRITDAGMSPSQTMPLNWNWTYLANQWQLPTYNTRKPIGYLLPYGSVGTDSGYKYSSKNTTQMDGHPYQSYSTFLVLNPKGKTATVVTNVEAAMGVTLSATKGTVVTTGIGGTGRTDTVTYSPAGYNPIYSTFDFNPDGAGALSATMNFGTKTYTKPVFRILGKTSVPTSVLYDGVAETGYVASVDTTTNVLYLALNRAVTGSHTLRVDDVVVDAGSDSSDGEAGAPWSQMAVATQTLSSFVGETYTWQDANNQPRTCFLVHNDALDPVSLYGGYVRNCTYKSGAATISADARSSSHPGWGYTVHHINGGSDADTMSSRRAPGAYRTVFAGKHHMLHEYTWTVLRSQGDLPLVPQVDRNINITIQYLFASGRSHPVWVHTMDTSNLAANALNADDRAPYGELKFDGVEGAISGLGWGDQYKFRTTSSPVTLASTTWTYEATNRVPHTMLWTDSNNLEVGAVQTESYTTKVSGYGWLYLNWGRNSSNKIINSGTPATQSMPADWNWTYQLVQYDIPWDANSKRFGWGTNTGSVGQSSYSEYGDATTGSGYPYRSHSVFYVLDQKGTTDTVVAQVENSLDNVMSATVGTVPTTGPAGIGGASANSVSYGSSGYDPVYGTFVVTAASNLFNVQFALGAKTLVHPILRVKSYTGTEPNTLMVGGVTLYKDVDYFASVLTFDGSNELWITLNKTLTGTVSVSN